MSPVPLFAQSTGTMSVDLLVEMFKTIPTLRQVKDEAGDPSEALTPVAGHHRARRRTPLRAGRRAGRQHRLRRLHRRSMGKFRPG